EVGGRLLERLAGDRGGAAPVSQAVPDRPGERELGGRTAGGGGQRRGALEALDRATVLALVAVDPGQAGERVAQVRVLAAEGPLADGEGALEVGTGGGAVAVIAQGVAEDGEGRGQV